MSLLLLGVGGAPVSTDTIAPTFVTGTTGNVAENATLSFTVTTDEATTKTIVGGADSAKFEFVSGGSLNVSHVLRFASNGTKNFEAPDDADTNNTYVVTVRAADAASNTTDQTITITVTDVVEYTTFSTTTDVTLSNGNLTATHANTNSNAGARSPDGKNSGKYYFEVDRPSGVTHGAFDCIGVLTAAGTFTNLVTNGTNCGTTYAGTGTIWGNGANSGRSIVWSTNIIGVAVDLDNEKIWFRSGASGQWNGQAIGSQDPANNIGGVSISNFSGTTMAPAVGFGGTGTQSGDTMTANFGQSAFNGAVPSGFTSGWPQN